MVLIQSLNKYGKLTTIKKDGDSTKGVILLDDGKLITCDLGELSSVKKKLEDKVSENNSRISTKRSRGSKKSFTVKGIMKQDYHSYKKGMEIDVKAEDYTSSASHDLVTVYIADLATKVPKMYVRIVENNMGQPSPYSRILNTGGQESGQDAVNNGGSPKYGAPDFNAGQGDPDLNNNNKKEDQDKEKENQAVITKLNGAISSLEEALSVLDKAKIHNPKSLHSAVGTIKSFIEIIKKQK